MQLCAINLKQKMMAQETEQQVISPVKTNRIALVTGGSRGLGKEMARSLAAKGIDVVITYNKQRAEGDAVVAEIEKTGRKAAVLQLDAGNTKSFDNFFSQF